MFGADCYRNGGNNARTQATFVLLLTTRESEAVPEHGRACALTTAPSALREVAAQGTPDISLDRSSTGGHALPPSPRSRNNRTQPREVEARTPGSRGAMDERIAHLQDRQFMEHADFLG